MTTQAVHTEQDTYDALRRVPRSHLEDTRPHECHMIARNEWRACEEDMMLQKELRKVAFMRKFSFIFGKVDVITMNTHLSRSDLAGLYDPVFKGTGWTTEDYGSLIYQEARAVLEHDKEVKKEKGRVVLLTYLLVALLSLLSGLIFPVVFAQIIMPVVIGFVGGMAVTKIVKHYNSKLKGTLGPF